MLVHYAYPASKYEVYEIHVFQGVPNMEYDVIVYWAYA